MPMRSTAARALLTTALKTATAHAEPPKLVKHGTATQLHVQGKPMLLIAGELGNSSASSPVDMSPHWPPLRKMNLNTVLAPVQWDMIEPNEDRHDWSSADTLIRSARANDLRIVALWFGAYKNSMSTYVPEWVKRDAEILSAHSPDMIAAGRTEVVQADRKGADRAPQPD